ncbi:MAG: DUF6922 domain-containing protein [Thermodesulfobacteriota bacterium]
MSRGFGTIVKMGSEKWEVIKMGSGNKIPEKIKRLFWDVDKDAVDINIHRFYIIRRIMDYGNLGDVQWMLNSYSSEDIVGVVKKSRGLSRRSAWFWVHYFRIPPEEVECLKTSFTQTQKK